MYINSILIKYLTNTYVLSRLLNYKFNDAVFFIVTHTRADQMQTVNVRKCFNDNLKNAMYCNLKGRNFRNRKII